LRALVQGPREFKREVEPKVSDRAQIGNNHRTRAGARSRAMLLF